MASEVTSEEFQSFLNGSNAAWLENLYASFLDDPNSVNEEWRKWFATMKDEGVALNNGPSWAKDNWPIAENGELVNALDGDWPQVEAAVSEKVKAHPANDKLDAQKVHQATRDSVSAIMMIRAYRMRGHLHADLDPLNISSWREAHNDLHPSTYGFTEADFDRQIFIDYMLGMEFATIREMLDILNRTYCSTLGIEFMHISDPQEKAWIQERIEGPDKGIAFTELGKKAILKKLNEAEGFERYLDVKYKGT